MRFFFQAEDGIRDLVRSRGLGDVYKRQVYYSTELGDWAQNVFLPLFNSFRNKKVKFPIPTDNKKDILFFKELIEGGNFRAIIDRKYPLEKIVEATKYVESGEKVGNVVITIF